MSYTNIDKPSKYFNTLTWTGDGTSRSLTGVGFSPDFVWVKLRSGVEWHVLNDSIRGATKNLYSNSTSAEITESLISSLNNDGFTVQNDLKVNSSGSTYVGWCWDANGAGSSNTQGSITSTVSANTTSGFSVVSYTGTGATATVGHGLGVAPRMIIFKSRNSATSWVTYHASLGATNFVALSNTDASSASSLPFNNTAPTSTVFSLGTSGGTNSTSMIAYCFAEVKGFSKAFSYTGNGSADGTFIYTGMRPAFVLLKRTDTADNWVILDNKRDTFNLTYKVLKPDSSGVEDTNIGSTRANVDFLSNGFKLRQTSDIANASGGTFIGFAIAENPFVSSKGVPVCAR